MNDTDLIEELQTTIERFMDGVCAPVGLAARARRIARRQAIARTAGAGGSVVAIAGVATMLATSSGVPSAARRRPATVAHARETAYILKKVRAALDSPGAQVTEIILQDGETDWMYIDPSSGVQYQRDISPGGVNGSEIGLVARPVDGYLHFATLTVDETDHTYSESESVASAPLPSEGRSSEGSSSSFLRLGGAATTGASPSTESEGADATSAGITSPATSAQAIRQALANGDVTEEGTTTIDGAPAIELVIRWQNGGSTTLFVDSQSYRVLREVISGQPSSAADTIATENWFPATAANIANAQLTAPAGYTQESPAGQ